ncbi:MAG: hypothetical protein WEC00_11875 [Dongiaceae bacterium]
MFTMISKGTRTVVSTVAAVAIVSFNGLVLDQAHLAAAPRGTVEIGELTPVDTTPIASVTLPEVTVIAKRESPADAYFTAVTQLPEVVVVAKRVARMVAKTSAADQAHSVSVKSSAEGALLK